MRHSALTAVTGTLRVCITYRVTIRLRATVAPATFEPQWPTTHPAFGGSELERG
jgi:hypothetical protein